MGGVGTDKGVAPSDGAGTGKLCAIGGDTAGCGRPPAGAGAAGPVVRIVAGTQGGSGVDAQPASSETANSIAAGRATCWTGVLPTGVGVAAFNRVVMVVILKGSESGRTAHAVWFDGKYMTPAGSLSGNVTRRKLAVARGNP